MAPAAGGKERNSSNFPGVSTEEFSTFFSVDSGGLNQENHGGFDQKNHGAMMGIHWDINHHLLGFSGELTMKNMVIN